MSDENKDEPSICCSIKSFLKLPEGEVIVSMANYKDKVIIATANKIYSLDEDGVLTLIRPSIEDRPCSRTNTH